MQPTRPFGPVLAVLGLLLTATVATPLVSCGATVQVPSALATDAALIDTLVQIEGPVLLAKPGLSVVDQNIINAAIAGVHTAALALQGASSLTANQAIVSGMQAVADVAARYLPAGSQEALQVQAAVRIAALFLPAGTAGAAAAGTMSLTEARARLEAMRR